VDRRLAPEEILRPLIPPEGVDLVGAHESLDRHLFGQRFACPRGTRPGRRSSSGSITPRSGTGEESWGFDAARKWKNCRIAKSICNFYVFLGYPPHFTGVIR